MRQIGNGLNEFLEFDHLDFVQDEREKDRHDEVAYRQVQYAHDERVLKRVVKAEILEQFYEVMETHETLLEKGPAQFIFDERHVPAPQRIELEDEQPYHRGQDHNEQLVLPEDVPY